MVVKADAAFADIFDSSILTCAAGYADEKKGGELFSCMVPVFKAKGKREKKNKLLLAVSA